jgi:2-hydroxychromene-2-carboxylate isomerase
MRAVRTQPLTGGMLGSRQADGNPQGSLSPTPQALKPGPSAPTESQLSMPATDDSPSRRPLTVDYYAAPQSPYVYLGHGRFMQLLADTGAQVRLWPIDLGRIFPVSGGLPLPQRAPQRQAYRLQELQRWKQHLGLPLNLHPKHFPVSGDAAARLLLAVQAADGVAAAMALLGRVLATVWADEGNISEAGTLAALLKAQGLPAHRLDDAAAPACQAQYEAATQRAIDAGVFGAPSFVVDGELFWGQDRLDFLQRRLQRG